MTPADLAPVPLDLRRRARFRSLAGAPGAAPLLAVPVLMLILAPSLASAETREVAELRQMLEQMKRDYEQRIGELEARLSNAEQASAAARRAEQVAARSEQAARAAESRPMTAAQVQPAAAGTEGSTGTGGVFGALTSGTAFNPDISVILDGNFYQDDIGGEGASLVGRAFQPGLNQLHGHDHADDGHDHGGGGHAHGTAENGFNFRSAEIVFSATVDPYFDAVLNLTVSGDGDVDLEEGYFQTRGLPWGLRAKGGKFLSDFGYANRQHPHEWDFVDQNLPYENLLGVHGIQDTGLQLTWIPQLPVYALFGVEALQGDQELFGATLDDEDRAALDLGDPNDGPRLWTGFVKVAPTLGQNHALLLGASYARNTTQQLVHEHVHAHAHQEDAHGHDHGDDDHGHGHGHGHEPDIHRAGMDGDADLWGLDLVYKYDGGGAWGKGDFKFQSEYLRVTKDLTIRSSAHPEQIGSTRKFTTDGLYAQATYGFAPRLSAGLRYDVLGLTNEVSGGRNADFGSSDRWAANVTWRLSEFSMLRAQYAWNNILETADERERFDAFYLQFQVSMGSHGAHRF